MNTRTVPPAKTQNANIRTRARMLRPTLGQSRAQTRGPAWPDLEVDTRTVQQLRAILDQLGTEQHTFAEATAEYRRKRCVRGLLKPLSLAAYTRALARNEERFGNLDVASDFVPLAAELYAAEGKTAWRSLQMLRGVLVLACRLGWRSEPHGLDEILRKAAYQPREAVYTEAQVAAFVDALDRLDRSKPLPIPSREVLRGLTFSGCRLGEVRCLCWDEVGPGYLRLRDSKTGPRTVPIGEQVQRLVGRQRVVSPWVFPGRAQRKPVSASAVQRAFHEAREEAGLRDGTVHTLRHSFATIAVRNGVPVSILQKILGHRTASYVTQRYIHTNHSDASLACAVVEQAIGGGRRG